MKARGRGALVGAGALAVVLVCASAAVSDITGEDLTARRVVLQGDWLRLRLEVLGLRLSYPAYRIELKVGDDRVIHFTLLASAGLVEHLGKIEKPKAEELLTYHAHGIREQVGQLLQSEFAEVWETYAPERDLDGVFVGPGEDWDDPPRTIATWKADTLSWTPAAEAR